MRLPAVESIAFALLFGACATPGGTPTPVRLENSYIAPDSLEVLATEVRSNGGIVVVGSASGSSVSRPPSVSAAPFHPGLFISAPLEAAGVTISDGLGDTTDANIVVIASAGPMILVDESGAPSADFYLASYDYWSWLSVPAEGQWVFFLSEGEGELWLRWRARVMPDGSVDGSLTRSGVSVPLSSLRTGV